MKTQMAYCSACDQQVRIVVTPQPLHEGQASIPDAEVICLDFGDTCTGSMCPMFGLPSILMGVRLARSGLRTQPWETVRALCESCGTVGDMHRIDVRHVNCPACGATSELIVMHVDDEGDIAITRAPRGTGPEY